MLEFGTALAGTLWIKQFDFVQKFTKEDAFKNMGGLVISNYFAYFYIHAFNLQSC